MSDVCRHGKTLNETCTACFPDDKAPELKPCPFCGEELLPQRGEMFPWRDHKSGTSCYMSGEPVFIHEAEGWNTRADLAHLPDEFVKFLLGEGPLEGVWFGDKHPTRNGLFWWRTLLRDILKEVKR